MDPAPSSDVDIDVGALVPELRGWMIHVTLIEHPAATGTEACYNVTATRPGPIGGTVIAGSAVCAGGLGPLLAAHTLLATNAGRAPADQFLDVATDVMIVEELAGLPTTDHSP